MKELKDTLWKAAEKLRGSVPANQYKDVILGLVFLQFAAEAHWKSLADNAKSPNIGCLVDEAIDAVMAANPALAGTLPQRYHTVDQRRLGELVELLDNASCAGQGGLRPRDLMGEVYEYFLGGFARTEGRRGGEFFTRPASFGRLSRSSNQPVGGCTTLAAGLAGCSCRQSNSSPNTTAPPERCRSTARKASRKHGGWPG